MVSDDLHGRDMAFKLASDGFPQAQGWQSPTAGDKWAYECERELLLLVVVHTGSQQLGRAYTHARLGEPRLPTQHFVGWAVAVEA
jgi:hypothetical protein